MKPLIFIILLFSLFALKCGLLDSDPDDDYQDDKILSKAYSSYKIPEEFYQENLDDGSIYYNNTLSILPLEERTSSSIQLSTDNRDQAREWSELTSKNSSYYRKLVDESENEKYFQFKRVYEQNPSDIILSRVHKSAYLDRSMYDLFNPGNIIGKYTNKPYQIKEVKELIEYLWFVEHYNSSGRKVLNSSIQEESSRFVHLIEELKIIRGDWGIHDQIFVLESTYSVDKTTGEISYIEEKIKEIQGRSN